MSKVQALRWTARVIGLVVLAFFAFGVVVGSQAMSSEPVCAIWGIVGLAILGYLVCWSREAVGGAMMLASGIGLAALSVAYPRLGSPLWMGAPFVVIGASFLVSRWMERRRQA